MSKSHQTFPVNTPKTVLHIQPNRKNSLFGIHPPVISLTAFSLAGQIQFYIACIDWESCKEHFLCLLFDTYFLALYPRFLQHQAYAIYCQVLRASLVYSQSLISHAVLAGCVQPPREDRVHLLSSSVILFENKAIHLDIWTLGNNIISLRESGSSQEEFSPKLNATIKNKNAPH